VKPAERFVDVVHGEHGAEVAESIHRGVAVIRDDRRCEEAGELDTAVPSGVRNMAISTR
jgi:hypothetical protein